MTDVNDSFRYCMQIFAHLCTSVSSYMAEPLQAEPLPADAVPEQTLEERQPEEARNLGHTIHPRVVWVGLCSVYDMFKQGDHHRAT